MFPQKISFGQQTGQQILEKLVLEELIGTEQGTLAAGNDSRIVAALGGADAVMTALAQANKIGSTQGTLAAGDDSRIVAANILLSLLAQKCILFPTAVGDIVKEGPGTSEKAGQFLQSSATGILEGSETTPGINFDIDNLVIIKNALTNKVIEDTEGRDAHGRLAKSEGNAGTITFTKNSVTITGTEFDRGLEAWDGLAVGTKIYWVESIESDISATLSRPFLEETITQEDTARWRCLVNFKALDGTSEVDATIADETNMTVVFYEYNYLTEVPVNVALAAGLNFYNYLGDVTLALLNVTIPTLNPANKKVGTVIEKIDSEFSSIDRIAIKQNFL